MLRHAAARLRLLAVPSSTTHIQPSTQACAAAQAELASTSGRPALQLYTRAYSAVAEQAAEDDLVIDDSAVQRLIQLQARTPEQPVVLRVEVEGGGCSGFQYRFRIDHSTTSDDRVFDKGGARVVCDSVSYGFLRGAVVEYEDSLMRSAFQIASNPNSEATCGCGSSFVAKM